MQQITPRQYRIMALCAARAVLEELRYARLGYATIPRSKAAEQLDQAAFHRHVAVYWSHVQE